MSRPTKKSLRKNRSKKTKQRRPRPQLTNPNTVVDSPFFNPVSGQFDIDTSVIPITPNNAASAIRYLNAHQLIPYDYHFDPIRDHSRVEVAATTLEKRDATEAEILRAIVLLGHSPCDTALETLYRWSNSDHLFASVARFALSECQSLMN